MDSLSPLRPYYYGDRKWDNYLLDIQEAVETGNSLQADALESARDQAEELRRQTAEWVRVQETLQNGFEEMRAEFHWGFSLLVDRLRVGLLGLFGRNYCSGRHPATPRNNGQRGGRSSGTRRARTRRYRLLRRLRAFPPAPG